ncbi:MAG: potassium transporter Kup [Burkholderiales bacterium]|nr:potassium transporter Kup [Burkholderiales bacterium]MCE7877721.1 potassium transporter Kup [Betaproteobacteria bacterium PRO3]
MSAPEAPGTRQPMGVLMLGAIGVVFGDVGTSPLYTMREVFGPHHGLVLNAESVLGLLSIVFWALMIIVTFKYVTLIMRADNRGEGGILALTALVSGRLARESRLRWWLVGLGIFGAAMFFGDAMITPAVTVLGAIEGIEVMTPALDPYVVPLALVILIALFAIQKHGTGSVGALFGPVCALWFVALALLGIHQLWLNPSVLAALSPTHAVGFAVNHPRATFLALGAVVLAVTGTEALYADMGHFGVKPIRRAWLFFVMPALVLNYFGQGALLLSDPTAIRNPFYLLAPGWALPPLVVLATAAAVIASQAVISGAYSIARAAVQMGYCPRIAIRHTSEKTMGQIYVPFINWTLLVAVALLVVGFQSSSALAGAYGIAVTMSMLIDSILIYFVMRRLWKWPRLVAFGIAAPLALIDTAFLASNSLKIPDGGWFPLLIGAVVFTLLTTWKRGRKVLMDRLSEDALPLREFIQSIELAPPVRVEGTAVFLTSTPDQVPHALLHNLKHNKVLHERVVFLTVVTRDIPYVAIDERLEIEDLGCEFTRMRAYYGFKEDPDVPEVMELADRSGFRFEMMETSFFVSRETLIPSVRPGMAMWRERLFSSMSKNAIKASDFFHVPANRVVELGTQVEL